MKFKHIALCAIFAATLTEPFWASDEYHAAKTLAGSNLTPTKIGHEGFTDYGWFRCGVDVYSTKFEATNVKGEKVEGYVCSNPFSKGSSLSINNR